MINKIKKLNIPTKISILIGLIVIIAGIYFILFDLRTNGVSMGEAGEPYGMAEIDGWGMIFCGFVIIILGAIIFNTKLNN